ncbi:hypothetical protein [Aureimonas sp. SK2]|uniref:hypothetical protein n=1 Tax=Aureimonas sp. SK2 TaxID=3015992 RepID=UPI0024444949|nr:hypothetical protein [Aureimonas sp. SK2]
MSSSPISQTSRPSYSNLGSDFAQLAEVVAMVREHMVANAQRIQHPDGTEGWFIPHDEGNQALSVLRMADQFGERVKARLGMCIS